MSDRRPREAHSSAGPDNSAPTSPPGGRGRVTVLEIALIVVGVLVAVTLFVLS